MLSLIKVNDNWALTTNVIDSGPGIDSARIPFMFKIFGELQRDHSHNSVKDGGIGIGLSCSKELVEYLGGEIQLNSRAGHTDVQVTIPVELQDESLRYEIIHQQVQAQNSYANILFSAEWNNADENKYYQHQNLNQVEEEEKCFSDGKKRRIDIVSESNHSISNSNQIPPSK